MGLLRRLLASRYQRFMWPHLSEADRDALRRFDGTEFEGRDIGSQLAIIGGITLIRNLLARVGESRLAFDTALAELRKEGGVAANVELPGLERHPRAAVAYLCLGAFYAEEKRVRRDAWRTVALTLFDEVGKGAANWTPRRTSLPSEPR